MNIAQIEENIQNLVTNISAESFIYDLLLAYGLPKATITLLKNGKHNLSKRTDQIILKKKLFFQIIDKQDPHAVIDELNNDKQTHTHKPRFIIVTDYETLLAIDTKTQDTLDVPLKELVNRFDFFLPWAGMEKAQLQMENPADIKAADKMAKIYDEILKDNPHKDKEDIHKLNVFLSRLLFCFFAEDTGIFEEAIFTNSIKSHTQENGSDLNTYLDRLFEVLDKEDHSSYPDYLQQFPYVNGGLFREKYNAPKFSRRSRKLILECGDLQWKNINPDIFGSMIQAVIDPDKRGGLGMHYTSVPNIMKVIEPLFLNELYEELENSSDSLNKLEKLLKRICSIKVFDPACGSGNFLIIAYKELRSLEMKIIAEIQKIQGGQLKLFSSVKLSQFFGIEIDDFACEIATLSLWLAEHQANMKYKELFGFSKPSLPLKESGKIVCGNATRLNWEEVCPKYKQVKISEVNNMTISDVENLKTGQLKGEDDEIYILGNPPYLGSTYQSKDQKEDMDFVFQNIKNYKNLDYVSCWFLKASTYIKGTNSQFAFVSTNSICQGEQVEMLWPNILGDNIEISFAHQSFKWTNNAKYNAGVTCAIIGLRTKNSQPKFLYKNTLKNEVKNINAYLSKGSTVIIHKKIKPLSRIPVMTYGNKPVDGGNLILSTQEKDELLQSNPDIKYFIRPLLGSQEYIRGEQRWCLWISEEQQKDAQKIPEIKKRIDAVKEMRLASNKKATQESAKYPYTFGEIRHKDSNSIIIPRVSSERREYIPCGFLEKDTIVVDSAQAVYNAEPWVFGIVTSRMHMVWVKAVAGRLKTDYRYSSALCYNTFPFPEITQKQKDTLTHHAFNVISEREKHPEKTLAELYDPDKMPDGLRQAHNDLDIAIEQCYRSKPFTSDEERLECLFDLYEKMTKEETIK